MILIISGILVIINRKVTKTVYKLSLISRIISKESVLKFQDVFKRSIKSKAIVPSLSITVIGQLLSGIRIYFVFLAFGLDPIFLAVLFINYVTLIIGFLSMIPGGFGSIEISGAVLFSTILNIDVVVATSAILLLRFITYVVDIPTGLICSYKLEYR